MKSNATVSNISLCHILNGGHIVSHPFPKENANKVSVNDGKQRATTLDLVNVFWPSEKER